MQIAILAWKLSELLVMPIGTKVNFCSQIAKSKKQQDIIGSHPFLWRPKLTLVPTRAMKVDL